MSKILELADAYAETMYLRRERHETRAALVAEVEKLEKDAARYRWLSSPSADGRNAKSGEQRNTVYAAWGLLTEEDLIIPKETLDAAIDAAMEATNGQCS